MRWKYAEPGGSFGPMCLGLAPFFINVSPDEFSIDAGVANMDADSTQISETSKVRFASIQFLGGAVPMVEETADEP